MKILQIVADGNPGGGTTFVLDVLKSLDTPYLLTQENSYALEKVGNIPKMGINFFTSRFDLRIAAKMQKVIRDVKPDLIHVHGGRAAFFLSFCRKTCPVLYTVHGLHGLHQGLKFSRFGERRAMKGATLVNFVSHVEEELALKNNLLKGTNHCVIPHGIDLNTIPPKKEKIPKLIGFMGRLCPQKDPLFMLEIMKILGPEGYRLRVIGGGEYEKVLKSDPYTMVTGKVSRDEGLKLLSEVECVVVPSRWEAFGLILLEAMALEVPIIASNIPPFEEVLSGGTFATLIDKKDPEKYAAAILEGADYTQAAKKHLLEKFSWEQCIRSYHSIFRELKGNYCYNQIK
ncbi:MAG: glycosyltransferase family 4 protein [Chlamydiales bacterium]|nr:glycosyltransferase family 4 protein [Chlamydiia bacterium]MCP5505004.1 glycosyltransferase family 4 protein [Chlamydiales bacterium]